MISVLTGNQMGPRQLELPPNRLLFDFRRLVAYPELLVVCGVDIGMLKVMRTRDKERIPYSLRNSFSSSMRSSTRGSFTFIQGRQQAATSQARRHQRWYSCGYLRMVLIEPAARTCRKSGSRLAISGFTTRLAARESKPTIERTFSLVALPSGSLQYIIRKIRLLHPKARRGVRPRGP